MLRRLLASPWPYFVLAALLVLVAVLSQVRVGIPTRPKGEISELSTLRKRGDLNVVLVVIDSLRADRLAAYGYERPTSPMLDRIAESGVRFAHVRAQSSWIKSSMASLWQAAYPVRTGILRYDQGIPSSAVLPAKLLRAAGYRTAGIHRSPWLDASFGFGSGFETYVVPSPAPRAPEAGAASGTTGPSDRDITDSALEFIRTQGSERFFLYVHYMDVARFFTGEVGAAFGTNPPDLYDAAVRWVDANLVRLVKEIDDRDLLKKTILVVASDQGEELLEHGGEGNGRTLYREVLDVPLLLSLPFRLRPGVVVQEPVENVDIWPTLLDLLGEPPLPNSDGRSLVPLVEAAAPKPGEAAAPSWTRSSFAELDRTWGESGKPPSPIVSLTEGTLQLISPVSGTDDAELFDVVADPGEQHNLAPDRPDAVASLHKRIDDYQQLAPLGTPSVVPLDAIRLQQLGVMSGDATPKGP